MFLRSSQSYIFPHICRAAAFSDMPLEKTRTHLSSTSERGFRSISFSHQSTSLARFISAAVLSVFQADGGNSSLGLPLAADPSPSQTTGWPPCFHYPHASKRHTTKSHTLLSRHTFGISEIPVLERAIPVSYA